MKPGQRLEVISAFGALLEKNISMAGNESELPYPKELIRQAIAEELVEPTMPVSLDALEKGFLHLEEYVSEQECKIVWYYEALLHDAKRREDSMGLAASMAETAPAALEILKRITKLQEERYRQIVAMKALRS